MSQCYCYRFLDTLDVVWNTRSLPLADVSRIRKEPKIRQKCFVYFNNFSNLLKFYLFQNCIFITCMLNILIMIVLMNKLWEKNPIFLRLFQTSLHSFRASSVKQCTKDTYERVIFNFNCTVSKFYCKYFSKVFTKLWEWHFLEWLILANSQCPQLNTFKSVKYFSASLCYLRYSFILLPNTKLIVSCETRALNTISKTTALTLG